MLISACAGNSKIVRTKEGYRMLIDKRNGGRYQIASINGKLWTITNASVGLKDACPFPSLMHNPVGIDGLTYRWELAQQVCPEGWRLPTSEELAELFQAYGKVAYAGDNPYYKKLFGPYQPDSTLATYQALLKDALFHFPSPHRFPGLVRKDIEQRTLFWSSDTLANYAYAIYWDVEKGVHFAAYPQSYFGFCRFVKIEKLSKKQQELEYARAIRKQEEKDENLIEVRPIK